MVSAFPSPGNERPYNTMIGSSRERSMSAPTPSPAGDSKSLATVLVPVAGVALIVVLVVVIGATSDSPKPTEKGKDGTVTASLEKLTDGTDPNAEDPGLKDIGQGLKIRDIKEGTGPECPPGASVVAHYTGWLTNGKVFDSSRKRGKPTPFSLGEVVPGWQKGIPGMKVGGVRKLVIPPELGYGARGTGRDIPPNATLVFEVELVEIN
jgi:FKBP-type peptidyl-prolyl cis-trans isomerase